MSGFLESSQTITCVGAHYYFEPNRCDLCEDLHAHEVFVIKNRSGRKSHVALACLKEMIRFRVAEVDDMTKWVLRLPDIKAEAEKKRQEEIEARAEERKRLEKKVIVRKKQPEGVN